MESTIVKIEKLRRGNYHTWAYTMEQLLVAEDLWDVVIEDTEEQELPQDADEAVEVQTANRLLQRRKAKALSKITSSMESSEVRRIIGKRNPYEVWQMIANFHKRSGIQEAGKLAKSFRQVKFKEPVDIFCEDMKLLADRIEEADEDLKICEKDLINTIFNCLPESFANIIEVLYSREDLSFEAVKVALTEAEDRMKSRRSDRRPQVMDAAFNAQDEKSDFIKSCKFCNGSHKYGKKFCPAAEKICKSCGKQGHLSKVCKRKGSRQSNIEQVLMFHELDLRPIGLSASAFPPSGNFAITEMKEPIDSVVNDLNKAKGRVRSCTNLDMVNDPSLDITPGLCSDIPDHDEISSEPYVVSMDLLSLDLYVPNPTYGGSGKTETDQIEPDPRNLETCMTTQSNGSNHSKEFFIDSGASSHISWDPNDFSSIEECHTKVALPDGSVTSVTGQGTIVVSAKLEESEIRLLLSNGLFIPDFNRKLISVSKLTEKGVKVIFSESTCTFSRNGSIIGTASLLGNLYALNVVRHQEVNAVDIDILHRRLGHAHFEAVKQVAARYQGLVTSTTPRKDICEACVFGKLKRAPFKRSTSGKALKPLDLIHADLCGPMEKESLQRSRYFLVLVDDNSDYVHVYFLPKKSSALDSFKEFVSEVQNFHGHNIKTFRSDGGGEFVSGDFDEFLSQNGIRRNLTVPHSPQQNGVAERMIQTLVSKARSMLADSGLPTRLWAEAVNTAVHVHNLTPGQDRCSPFEKWFGRIPDKHEYKKLRIFGSPVLFKILGDQKHFSMRAERGRFIGYSKDRKAYRILKENMSVVPSRDVVFQEIPSYATFKIESEIINDDTLEVQNDDTDIQGQPNDLEEKFAEREHVINERDDLEFELYDPDSAQADPISFPDIEAQSQDEKKEQVNTQKPRDSETNHYGDETQAFRKSNRTMHSPPRLTPSEGVPDPFKRSVKTARSPQKNIQSPSGVQKKEKGISRPVRRYPERKSRYQGSLLDQSRSVSFVESSNFVEPLTYEEAINGEFSKDWSDAISKELKSLEDNKTWQIVDSEEAEGKNLVTLKWVFKVKFDELGNFQKFKARLVARGFTQRYGVDYLLTSSPVISSDSVLILIALSAIFKLECGQVDFVTAYLNGKMDFPVYAKPVPGIHVPEGKVLKFEKAIYGLKQSGLLWYNTLTEYLVSIGFTSLKTDPCVFQLRRGPKDFIIIGVYVDDTMIIATSLSLVTWFKIQLEKTFKIEDCGALHFILGMRIQRTHDKIYLDMEAYFDRLLEAYGMKDANSAPTPCVDYLDSNNDLDVRPIVGSLLYPVRLCRPDLSFSVGIVSRHASESLSKRILRYIRGSTSLGLVFPIGGSSLEIIAYVDSDWAGDVSDRKSISRYAVFLGGCLVSWSSKKQTSVALSSCEAELMGLKEVCKQVLFVRNFLQELGFKTCTATIFVDNAGTIQFAENVGTSRRMKHIDIHYHFVRDLIRDKIIKISHVASQENFADGLTKPLSKVVYRKFVEDLGLGCFSQGGV